MATNPFELYVSKLQDQLNEMVLKYNQTYTVFDIETTGLKYQDCYVTEIGAVQIKNGEVISRFQLFVNNGDIEFPEKIIQLTGITKELCMEQGYTPDVAFKAFNDYIQGTILVAQNSSRFDIPFLTYHMFKNGIPFYIENHIDTMLVSREQFPNEKSHALKTLCSRYEVEYDADSHHRADYDAEITANVFIKQLTHSPFTYKSKMVDENSKKFTENTIGHELPGFIQEQLAPIVDSKL